MRRAVIIWSVVGAIVLGAFGITVLALNSTLYSASGFVLSYLDALGRKDAPGALELAGEQHTTDEGEEASSELLVPAAMANLTDVEVLRDESTSVGTHLVTFGYSIDGQKRQSTFEVIPSGVTLGVFTNWSFVTSPVSVMYISVLHDSRFTANGIDLVSPAPDAPAPYLVFTPGNYELEHESRFLTAQPVVVTIDEAGASMPTAVDVQANEKFVAAVQKEVDAALNECSTQQVLLPTGCPFGQSINNRVVTTPMWSMSAYPAVTITPGTTPQWRMPPTEGAAHLVVDVRSIFDGSVSTFDEDVPFTVGFTITILSDSEIVISPAS